VWWDAKCPCYMYVTSNTTHIKTGFPFLFSHNALCGSIKAGKFCIFLAIINVSKNTQCHGTNFSIVYNYLCIVHPLVLYQFNIQNMFSAKIKKKLLLILTNNILQLVHISPKRISVSTVLINKMFLFYINIFC
jgi:hypothetical protein